MVITITTKENLIVIKITIDIIAKTQDYVLRFFVLFDLFKRKTNFKPSY